MVSSTEQTPMSSDTDATLDRWQSQEYKYGFYTDIETDTLPPGLNEDVVRLISAKKKEPDWLLQWRLKAYRNWLTMTEPTWQNVHYEPIDYQSIVYYSAPKQAKDRPQSLDDVDQSGRKELWRAFLAGLLGILVLEQALAFAFGRRGR